VSIRARGAAAVTALLLTATLGVSEQAFADTAPAPSPPATATADPTGTPQPADTSTAGPLITSVDSVDIDGTGTEVRVAATSPSPITSLAATLTLGDATSTTSAFTLVSGTDTDGVWETTGALGLAHGTWTASVTATDAAGDPASAPVTGTIDYNHRTPVVTGSFTTDHLDFENQTDTLNGKVWAYDPATGGDDPAWAGSTVELWGFPGSMTSVRPAADGSFTLSTRLGFGDVDYPVPTSFHFFSIVIPASGSGLPIANGPTTDVAFAQSPVRFVQDAPVTFDYGHKLTLSGTAEYYSHTSETWLPLANTGISVNNDTDADATTDAKGHFSWSTVNTPFLSGSWQIHLANVHSAYLLDSESPFKFTVISKTYVCECDAWFNNDSTLHLQGSLGSSAEKAMGKRRLYLEQSQNGKTGWTSLGYLVTASDGSFDLDAYVSVPHGYWRLYFPATTGYQASYSNVVHYSYDQTRVTGGKPSSTSVYSGRTVTFSGSVQQNSGSGWSAVKNQYVYLVFRPYKSKTWTARTRVRTNSHGNYRVSARATRGGTWCVVYLPDAHHVDAEGPMTYVHIR
jgi:hypothetical protein